MVPDDVQAVGKYAYDLAGSLRKALNTMAGEVDEFIGKGWVGTAANGFSSGWNECSDGGHRIIDALTAMAEALGITADTYRGTDSRSATELTNLNLS